MFVIREKGPKMASKRIIGALVTATMVPGLVAQSWGVPFNHERIDAGPVVPNPNATDHLLPFGGHGNPNIAYFNFLGQVFDWSANFNAVHMSVIPKGPHQGKVLVWGSVNGLVGSPVILRSPGSGPVLGANEYHSCSAWSIIDPSDNPTGPRFRNFLLPIERFTPPATGPVRAASLFCSGHVWSPYGDLVVVGGTQFGVPTLQGPRFTFAVNMALSTRGWSSSPGVPLYPGQVGLWEPGPNLQADRFYPTATLTSQLQRLGSIVQPPREVILVSGGSVDDASSDPLVNHTWNSYEALVVSQEAQLLGSGLSTDSFGGQSVWPGPGSNTGTVEEDWLEDYPRMHQLSTGEVLFSGYAPRWAKVDHDAAPGTWARQATAPWSSTIWQHPRHDGTSVLFPNVGGLLDMVVRMGGSDEVNYVPGSPYGTTPTIEAFISTPPGGGWAPAGDLPKTLPTYPDGRYLMNVVLLPDASLLALGGAARAPGGPNVPVLEPLLYKNGAWSVLPANPVPSVRDYHSTAALLPDGRVILGGGNARNWDYEIFSPAYMNLRKPRNVRFPASQVFDPLMSAWQVDYNSVLRVACDEFRALESIQKVVLMAPASTTHHSDMHMRYVQLDVIAQPRANAIDVRAPLNDKFAPRGIYMMFVVTNLGAVADALWVVLR